MSATPAWFAVPSLPRTFIHRPRLSEALAEGLDRPLLLVSGPAGAGKSLLVAEWVCSTPVPGGVAWLTLEGDESEPGVFWTCVLSALAHHGVPYPADLGGPAGSGQTDPALPAKLAAWLNRGAEPVTLVVDDFQKSASAPIATQLHDVLRHAAGGLRLVLISRAEPLLPLHRYRAAGEIAEIRGDDLAFTVEETCEVLSRHGLDVRADSGAALTERTEGWAAGIRLAALAATRSDNPELFLKEFEAGHSTIADFLTAEVLDNQPAAARDLLVRTSILDRTHPDLANELTGRDDASALLESLRLENAFVEAVGDDWYRIHSLFAETLRVHLHARLPGLEAALHRRAARWLRGAGMLDAAVRHAVAVGDWDFAASAFIGDLAIGRLVTGIEANGLETLFSHMPADVEGPAPELIRAALDLSRHDADTAIAHVCRAEEQLSDNARGAPLFSPSCAFVRVMAGALLGSADLAQAAAGGALDFERDVPGELLHRHPEFFALVHTALGSAMLLEGRIDTARAAFTAAADPGGGPRDGTAMTTLRHESLSRLAFLELLEGWHGRAEAQASAARAEAERLGLPSRTVTGVNRLVLASVAADRDELCVARADVEHVARSCSVPRDPVTAVELTVLRSGLLLAGNDARGALEVLGEASSSVPDTPWTRGRLALAAGTARLAANDPAAALEALSSNGLAGPEHAVAAARCHLAAGDTDAAAAVLSTITGHDEVRGSAGAAIVVRVLLARAQLAAFRRDDVLAGRLLARALSVAQPDRIRRPFREAGPWVRRLLRRQPALVKARGRLAPELDAASSDPTACLNGYPPVVEPLTEREREVLDRVAQLLPTDAIAADLHLSVNTVKTHLKSINRKLCTTRRGEAVRRARELRIL